MSSIKTDSMVSPLRSNANNAAVIPEKQSKQQQNAAILAASEKVALQSNNNILSLLYKTALEGINDALEPTLGKNASKKIYESGIDTSPEATAERIVSFATSLFNIYKQQKPSEDSLKQLDDFMGTIGKGIEQGFSDAKAILTGLKVFEGDVEKGVASTYDMVLKGLQNFREKLMASYEQQAETAKSEPATKSP
ncbi:DUF5610 domain-containing protein [Rheinheimera sp. UJ63]|uniref:DUF5610 domain-containing protein n=1 Tax=Rheinheimera sp. UJ63 TaxID=2910157 RepID=UPI001F24B989|nr:DUF5610 domain-containing protein [Rheinheimera sp. UJ63]MCF4009313.1 DUF5610 domain-containing protein [Rheinheimera sp. UJ63]